MPAPARAWGAATLLVAIALGAVAPAADAQETGQVEIGVRLAEAPTDRADDPRASAYVIDHVGPGDELSRRIEVRNDSAVAVDLDLYPAAADIVDGGFRAADGRTANELAGWVSVEPARMRLGAGETATAIVRIAVARDATAGERYAAVLVEHRPERVAGAEVAIVTRVGIRLYLSVGGDAEPATDFTIDDLRSRTDGAATFLTATVRNTGGRAIDVSGEATLTDGPGGLSGGPFHTGAAVTLAPGDTGEVDVELHGPLPAGDWTAHLSLTSGTTTRTADAVVTLPEIAGSAEPAPAIISAEGVIHRLRSFGRALVGGVALPITVAVAIGAFLLLQRRLDARDPKVALAPSDADGHVRFE